MQPSTDQSGQQSISALTPRELAEALVKHYDLHEGVYALSIEFQVGVGAMGKNDDNTMPGAFIAFKSFGLKRVIEESRNTVDASKINPVRAKKLKRTAVKKQNNEIAVTNRCV